MLGGDSGKCLVLGGDLGKCLVLCAGDLGKYLVLGSDLGKCLVLAGDLDKYLEVGVEVRHGDQALDSPVSVPSISPIDLSALQLNSAPVSVARESGTIGYLDTGVDGRSSCCTVGVHARMLYSDSLKATIWVLRSHRA